MKDYKKLIVWRKAHELALLIYMETKNFPQEEKYGITSQLRRAAVSIPTNIAEGCGKLTPNDLARYLQISLGSAHEVEYLTYLSCELSYQKRDTWIPVNEKIGEVKAMLISLIKKVRTQNNVGFRL